MSASDYAVCRDAGRGEPRDVRDEADQLRKQCQEGGYPWEDPRPEPILCPSCGMPDMREVMRVMPSQWSRGMEVTVEYVDLVCIDCGYRIVDEEGGI
jgi:rubrerythrin